MSRTAEFDATELDRLARGAVDGTGSAFGGDVTMSFPDRPSIRLVVRALVGFEALHERYHFDVVCLAPSELLADPIAELLGVSAFVHLLEDASGAARVVSGAIERVAILSTQAAGAGATAVRVLQLRLVPALSLLAHTRRSRVFQGLSADRIVSAVLDAEHVAVRCLLTRPLPIRTYAVQYEESDAEFVERLVHEDGLVGFFDHFASADEARAIGHDRAGECWVIGDGAGVYAPIGEPQTLALVAHGQAGDAADVVHTFERIGRVRPTSIVLRNADPNRARPAVGRALPSPERDGSTAVDGGVVTATARSTPREHRELEVYEHHAPYEEPEVGAAFARTQLEQLRTGSASYEGTSRCPRLRPGKTFRLAGALDLADVGRADAGDFAVVSVEHRYFARGAHADGGDERYMNRFSCVTATTVHRPPRPTRRVVQAVETATVVGVVGEDVTTTSLGAVKIQFPWDRTGTNDDASSCWVRVSQPWSGPGYGFQFIPRVGAEVLVAFVGGDPDRPVVVGCLPNTHNTLPFALPDSATQSGIRTRSSPGGEDYNELAFVDTRGSEAVRLRAARDHEEEVVRNQRARVGGDQSVLVGEARTVSVAGHDALHVGGGRTERVVGEDARTVVGLSRDVVERNAERAVGGDEIARIEGTQSTVVGGDLQLIVGADGQGSADIQASGDVRLVGKDRLDLFSMKEIRLVCGDTRVTLTPEGLFVDAPRIVLRSPDIALTSEESSLELGDAILLSSEVIRLEGEEARLSLGRDARLQGTKIAMSGPEARASDRDSASSAPGEAVFRISPTAAHPGPFTLHIAAPTGEILERTTDANHEVRLEGGDRESFVLLRVRSGDTELHHHEPD